MINTSLGNPTGDSNKPTIPNQPATPYIPTNPSPAFPTHNPAAQNKTFMSSSIPAKKSKPAAVITPTTSTITPKVSKSENKTVASSPKFPDPTAPPKTPPSSDKKSDKPKSKKKINVKIIASVFVLLLIVLGSSAGFYLSQQTQDLRQRAYGTGGKPSTSPSTTLGDGCGAFPVELYCNEGEACIDDVCSEGQCYRDTEEQDCGPGYKCSNHLCIPETPIPTPRPTPNPEGKIPCSRNSDCNIAIGETCNSKSFVCWVATPTPRSTLGDKCLPNSHGKYCSAGEECINNACSVPALPTPTPTPRSTLGNKCLPYAGTKYCNAGEGCIDNVCSIPPTLPPYSDISDKGGGNFCLYGNTEAYCTGGEVCTDGFCRPPSASNADLNFNSDGTNINTSNPTIGGSGIPSRTEVNIEINSETQIQQTLIADENGEFILDISQLSESLEPGSHTATYSYTDPTTGELVEKTINFTVSGTPEQLAYNPSSSTATDDSTATSSGEITTATESANQPTLPTELPETGPEDWLNWLKAGLVTLGVGAALFLLL